MVNSLAKNTAASGQSATIDELCYMKSRNSSLMQYDAAELFLKIYGQCSMLPIAPSLHSDLVSVLFF